MRTDRATRKGKREKKRKVKAAGLYVYQFEGPELKALHIIPAEQCYRVTK